MATAPTLYLIHGWTYTTKPWQKTIALLTQAGVKVVMLNVPGLTAPSSRVWDIQTYVEWAERELPAGAVALGHSNGGRILLNLCAQHPTKLRQLILLNSAGVYEPSRRRDFFRIVASFCRPLKRLPLLRKLLHKLIGASDYAHAPANMQKTLSNLLRSDQELNLSAVSTPTTILWGTQDTVTPLRQGQTLARMLPHAQLQVFPSWRHAPYIDDPAGLAQAILAVLKGRK